MFESLSKTYSGQIIPKRTKWVYSSSGFFRDASYALMSTVLLIFIAEAGIIGVDGFDYAAIFGVISGLIIGFRIFDGFNDPIMGVIIEKVKFKTGKYKPWISLGGLVSTFTYLALFCGPVLFPWCRNWNYVWWFAIFYLLWDIGFTMNDIAYWSMLPSMSSDKKERASATSLVLIFSNIGEFAVTASIPVLTQNNVLGPKNGCLLVCIVVSVLFLVSQVLVWVLCKEKDRSELDKNAEEPVKFKDLWLVLKNNSQARTMIFVIMCYFISTMVMNGLMSYLFYITIGYDTGKTMQTILTTVNSLAVLVPPLFMPLLIKKFSLRKVFNVSIILMFASRVIFLFYNMPFGSFISAPTPVIHETLTIGFIVLQVIISCLMTLTQTMTYNALIIMMSNTIEYNEYKFGKREDAVIFSLRPFSTKLASSLNQGVQIIALNVTGVISINNQINDINSRQIPDGEKTRLIAEVLSQVTAAQIWGIKLIMIVVPLIFMALAYFLVKKFYIIDENMYKMMCDEIEKRNQENKAIKKCDNHSKI